MLPQHKHRRAGQQRRCAANVVLTTCLLALTARVAAAGTNAGTEAKAADSKDGYWQSLNNREDDTVAEMHGILTMPSKIKEAAAMRNKTHEGVKMQVKEMALPVTKEAAKAQPAEKRRARRRATEVDADTDVLGFKRSKGLGRRRLGGKDEGKEKASFNPEKALDSGFLDRIKPPKEIRTGPAKPGTQQTAVPVAKVGPKTTAASEKAAKAGDNLAAAGTRSIAMLQEKIRRAREKNRVWMSPLEQQLIEFFLQPGKIMLEWGSGYSTLWFSQFVGQYYSIEHDKGWYEEILPNITANANTHYRLSAVEKGHKAWEGGFSEGNFDQFAEYVMAVDDFQVPKFDRVLVDGRARASCAEYVLKYLHKDSFVWIHDYVDRPFYHDVVKKYYKQVAMVTVGQSIVVLQPTEEALQAAQEGKLPIQAKAAAYKATATS